jgi:hypothetical protein
MNHHHLIDKLLSGYNEHVKIASRAWIALALLSIYSIAISTLTHSQNPKLPFVNIDLPEKWFSLISLGLLAALINRWVEAQSRSIRTRNQLVEPLLQRGTQTVPDFTSKDVWDARVYIGTTTVWSAPASIIRSKHTKISALGVPYLIFLKIVTISIHFGLPLLAIALTLKSWFFQVRTGQGLITVGIISFAAIATLQLTLGIIGEIRYAKGSMKRMRELLAKKPK